MRAATLRMTTLGLAAAMVSVPVASQDGPPSPRLEFAFEEIVTLGQAIPVGETPLGNLAAPVGTHEIVFRHPSYGEQRRTIAVPARSIARVSVNFVGR